ncbi:MAG: CDP-glucose 4,6-dehydratase [Gemmatimonadales bacterium]
MKAEFWSGRRVLITGHTGFKGGWLSLWLQRAGADVTGYALEPPTRPSLFDTARVADGMRSYQGDVRDLAMVERVVRENTPAVLIHMAAQSVVRRSYREPVETYSANVMGTVNVLEAVRGNEMPCAVVIVTSDKCYDPQSDAGVRPPHNESAPLGGHDPYSNSKACAELVAAAYRDSYFPPERLSDHGIGVATVRAGNAIGGGDWTEDQLIPDLVRAAQAGRPALLRNPAAVRPWQFVLEPLRGYLQVAERLAAGDPNAATSWNFGPAPASRPVGWIADRFATLWGEGVGWDRDPNHIHPAETHSLRLDSSKARDELGWTPVVSLDTALEWIVEWYRDAHRGVDAAELTLRDIQRYTALLPVAELQHLPAAI